MSQRFIEDCIEKLNHLSVKSADPKPTLLRELIDFDANGIYSLVKESLSAKLYLSADLLVEEKIQEIIDLSEQKESVNFYASRLGIGEFSWIFNTLEFVTCTAASNFEYNKTSLTMNRLRTMFPQYCNLKKIRSYGTRPTLSRLHGIFSYPEFGGVVPRRNASPDLLRPEARLKVELLHLYCLCSANPLYSPAMHFELYRIRNSKSLLKDDQRLQMLENYGIVTSDGNLTSLMIDAVAEIKFWTDSILAALP